MRNFLHDKFALFPAYMNQVITVPYKDVMQGKLFQKCTHLLYCSVLSLGANVNTRRMSKPNMGSIFHIKKSMKYSDHRKLLCELSKLSKFNTDERRCIYDRFRRKQMESPLKLDYVLTPIIWVTSGGQTL